MKEGDTVLETLEAQVAPGHTALVIVDVQNDFVHPDGYLGRQRLKGFADTTSLLPGMLERLPRLLEAARQAGVLTVFIQMTGDAKYISPAGMAQRRRIQGRDSPGAVLEGTWGADFYGDIRPDGRSREVVVKKYRYSAFWGTNLDLLLRSNGIKTLVMSGDATSGCVESTTRDAFMNEYYVVTARDCCADFDLARHEASLRKIDLSFGYVAPSEEIINVWRRAEAPAGWKAAREARAR